MEVEFILSKNKSVDLDTYKQLKIDQLTKIADSELLTFKSSALGTEYTYLSRMEDMLLLSGQYSFVKGSDYDNGVILWYTVEGGNLSHTAAQFIQVYLDARLNVQTVKYKMATLTAQILACTDQASVDAIAW